MDVHSLPHFHVQLRVASLGEVVVVSGNNCHVVSLSLTACVAVTLSKLGCVG